MIIMLFGEFDLWRIQLGFQPVVCLVRDNDGLQGFAASERLVANARYGVGDGDGLQGWATIKRKVANAGHGVGDGDGLQEFATTKRIVANTGHRVGDDKTFSLW